MKINLMMQSICLSTIEKLHYIVMHTDDLQVRNECKDMINTLNERVISPAIEYCCLVANNGD
jgi:hypothetical protein